MLYNLKLLKYTRKDHFTILANVFIRGLNLLSKFFLSIYLAKYFAPDFLGSYTIFFTTVTVGIYFLGFEFYAFSQREYLKKDISQFANFVKNQFVFHFIGYLILLPLVYLSSHKFISSKHLILFFIILILEHLNQEFYRLLVVIKKTVAASINIFFRSGFWIFFFIYISVLDKNFQNLTFLYWTWIIGQIICFFFSCYALKNFGWMKAFSKKIEWQWIMKGIKISSLFFLSGVMQKTMEYSERFYLQEIVGSKMVGIYFFFYNIAYLPYIFFTTVLIVNYLPSIISSFNSNEKDQYQLIRKQLITASKYFALFFYSASVILFFLVTHYYLDNKSYLMSQNIFWILLLASSITIISEIQYIDLYIRHFDKFILLSFAISTVVHLISNYFLINNFGLFGAGMAKVLVVCVLLISRLIFTNRYIKNAK